MDILTAGTGMFLRFCILPRKVKLRFLMTSPLLSNIASIAIKQDKLHTWVQITNTILSSMNACTGIYTCMNNCMVANVCTFVFAKSYSYLLFCVFFSSANAIIYIYHLTR